MLMMGGGCCSINDGGTAEVLMMAEGCCSTDNRGALLC